MWYNIHISNDVFNLNFWLIWHLFYSSRSVVFWFGDLNFRIEDYDIHVVKCAIDSNKLTLLWERDQVRNWIRDIDERHWSETPLCLLLTHHNQQGRCCTKWSPSAFHSSTWLRTQSPSWKASLRDSSGSHLPISLMWEPIRMTPGMSIVLHPELREPYFILTGCSSSLLLVLRRGNPPGRIVSSGAFVVPAPLFLPTMPHCSGVSPHGWVVPLKLHSTCTRVTWATPSVTTSPFLPCFHCMWGRFFHTFLQIHLKFIAFLKTLMFYFLVSIQSWHNPGGAEGKQGVVQSLRCYSQIHCGINISAQLMGLDRNIQGDSWAVYFSDQLSPHVSV